MKRLTAIMLKASDIVSLCFLIPLLFISFSLYRSVEFGTLRESTFEVRDNPFVNLLILIAVLLLFVLIKKGMKRCGEPSGMKQQRYSGQKICIFQRGTTE